MSEPVRVAEVILWGTEIGAVAWDNQSGVASFEYTRAFQPSGIKVAPLTMPLGGEIYSFPGLARDSFVGLPGMLADSLPDKFGNLLIDQWLAREGRDKASFNPVERLCYMGTRGMGALEYRPALRRGREASAPVAVDALVRLASQALSQKDKLSTTLDQDHEADAIHDIIRVGTSAGGARAKAVIAWNQATGEVRSGQVTAPPGFGYWLIKFDGVSGNRDKESVDDPKGYGKIEYAYALMAKDAGIDMTQCRLFHENGRSHFMTQRFDRDADGGKRHMQTLCALRHYDFNRAGGYSYEQAMATIQELGLARNELLQQFRRMIFNITARNQDDHTKNIAFLMDKSGQWELAPAYDVTYSYNPHGAWTGKHQMTLNGKQDGFDQSDFFAVGQRFGIKKSLAKKILSEVRAAVEKWPEFARLADVSESGTGLIKKTHRLDLL